MIGPFIIKLNWIFSLGAIFSAYYVVKFKLREEPEFSSNFLDVCTNAVFIGIISSKLSSFLFEIEQTLTDPLSVLFLAGGWREWFVGIFLSFAYLFWQYKEKQWPLALTIQGFVYGTFTFVPSYWLFRTLYFLFV